MNATANRPGSAQRRRLVRSVAATAVLLLSLAMAVTPQRRGLAQATSSSPASWATACGTGRPGLGKDNVDLAPAPLGKDPDTNPDGTPVRISPDRRGKYVPVIMVHGWVGKDTHIDARDGAFSHFIDLTTNRLGQVRTTRSLIGQLQRIPGAAVFTFDYRDSAARWVDEQPLGPALGNVIDCLYQASGEKVIVVAHSMGGLIARYAATHPGVTGADRSGEISTVVTFGTPETGSILAALAAGIVNGAAVAGNEIAATIRLILAVCGRLTSIDQVGTGTLCDGLPEFLRAFDSDAGAALRAGSPQLAVLEPFPASITVDALAGRATMVIQDRGWFGLSWANMPVDVGDIVVTTGSALHGASMIRKVSCAYQISVVSEFADQIGARVGLLSKADVAPLALGAFNGACFHKNLMRDIELTNEATGAVNDDIAARQPVTANDLLSAPVPANCQHKAGTLTNGRLLGIPANQGVMELAWLDRPVAEQRDLLALGDLTGDGGGDAATVLYCNAGGVSWPEMVSFYTHGPKLLGTVFLEDVNLPGHEPGENDNVRQLRYHDGAVTVEWTTQQRGDPAANATLDYAATLRWNGRKVVVSGLSGMTEQPTVDQFVGDLAAGNLSAAATLAAPGVAAEAAGQLRAYPAAARARATCYGPIALDLPPGVANSPALGDVGTADRWCLLPAGAGTVASWIVLGMRHTGFRHWQVAWSRLS
jgi:pimeloyl-ACP methyl ester carboxylesterase